MLIVLGAASGGVYIISSVSVVGAPIGITGESFTLILSLKIGIIKKLQSTTRNKKKSIVKLLCWLKVNSMALKL